nr:MAG TPA: hypothetical protein [Bacteriophage sp.]
MFLLEIFLWRGKFSKLFKRLKFSKIKNLFLSYFIAIYLLTAV